MSNRREFVTAATGGALLAGLGAAPSALACRSEASVRRLGGSPSLAAFESMRGDALQLVAGDGTRAEVELIAVRGQAKQQRGLEQFSLVMRGGADLPGGIYRVRHADLGSFAMRVDAGGSDDVGTLYVADFSLLT